MPTPGPVPRGFGIVLDPSTRQLDATTLFGGASGRVLRLNRAGAAAWPQLCAGTVDSAAAGVLARRLTDAGLAHPRPPAIRERPDVTVVVPVRDRAGSLDCCLAALGTDHPVIVVDDASRNPAAVAEVAAGHGAKLLRRDVNGGAAVARNTALVGVRSALIGFVDSDCRPEPGWVERLAGHFADPLVGAVAPRIVALDDRGVVGRYGAANGSLDLGEREARVTPGSPVPYVPTAALVVRTAAIDALGDAAFDPALRVGEDVDLVWRLGRAGWRIRYDPSVRARHEEPLTWRALLARRFRYGTSTAPLARRHPGAVPPLVLHPWSAAPVVALLAGRPGLAVAALAGSAASLHRALRRVGMPARGMLPATVTATGRTFLGLGRYATQFAAPALLAAIVSAGGRGGARRVAAAALLLAPPLVSWVQRRPRLDPVRYAVAQIADDVAYGAGVWTGCVRARSTAPLRPVLRRHRIQVGR